MTRRRKVALAFAALLTLGLFARILIPNDERKLAHAVRHCDRVVVKPSPYSAFQNTLELPGSGAVRDLVDQFQFKEVNSAPCKCEGDIVFEFYEREKLIATVSYHHSSHLRWWNGSWKGDDYLTEDAKRALPIWLKSHGFVDADKLVPLPRKN